jgi:hypothetical protein
MPTFEKKRLVSCCCYHPVESAEKLADSDCRHDDDDVEATARSSGPAAYNDDDE